MHNRINIIASLKKQQQTGTICLLKALWLLKTTRNQISKKNFHTSFMIFKDPSKPCYRYSKKWCRWPTVRMMTQWYGLLIKCRMLNHNSRCRHVGLLKLTCYIPGWNIQSRAIVRIFNEQLSVQMLYSPLVISPVERFYPNNLHYCVHFRGLAGYEIWFGLSSIREDSSTDLFTMDLRFSDSEPIADHLHGNVLGNGWCGNWSSQIIWEFCNSIRSWYLRDWRWICCINETMERVV